MNKIVSKILFLVIGAITILFILRTDAVYDYIYQYKTYTLSQQNEEFKGKIWAHRVNSIGKAREASFMFQGIEIDVVFDGNNNNFDVNHPPDESIHLSLENLLESLPKKPATLSYWLDYKNLNKANLKSSLEKLVQLSSTFQIKRSSIIVESDKHTLLPLFTEHGFKTSYYLPTSFISTLKEKDYRNLTTVESQSLNQMQHAINQGNFDYISTYSKYHFFVNGLLSVNKKILLWNVGLEHHNYFDMRKIKKILALDKNIQVLLIQFDSKYDR